MLPKLTEMERNWIIFAPAPTMVLSKIFNKAIWGKAIWNSWEKIKLAIPREQDYVAWLVKNEKTVFSKLNAENFFVSIRWAGDQVSKHLATSFPFSGFSILSSFYSCYFSGMSCMFCCGQIFTGFLTSTFDFYWSLALQFSCIMVRISQGTFLIAVASY